MCLLVAIAASAAACGGNGDSADSGVPSDASRSVSQATSTGTATLRSPGYQNSFTLGTCSLNADVSNISLRGNASSLALTVDASDGRGSLGVSGGDEQDGITLNGTVSKVTVGPDRSFTLTGTFTPPNSAGEAFTLTGACPE